MRLLCLLRGGHRWHTTSDAAGTTTTCSRCGALRHLKAESVEYGVFKGHTNLAYKWPEMPSHGGEEVDDEG